MLLLLPHPGPAARKTQNTKPKSTTHLRRGEGTPIMKTPASKVPLLAANHPILLCGGALVEGCKIALLVVLAAVVEIVRVEGRVGLVLLSPTEVGLSEQVISTFREETAQVRFTVPLKPFGVATVMVEVESPPGFVLTLVGLAVSV